MKRLFGWSLLIILAGCAWPKEFSSHLTKDEANTVATLAREKVMASGLVNEAKEIEIIKNTSPSLNYYFLARPYADYTVNWRVNDKESIVIYGRGNILMLEGAQIARRSSASVKSGT